MPPFDIVNQHYRWPEKVNGRPFIPEPLQIEAINETAPLATSGQWAEPACGKTFIATWIALYWKVTEGLPCVVVMPPLLIPQWGRWLRLISPALSVTEYAGSPAERRELSLDSDFVLVGIQIFKRDYDRFRQHYKDRRLVFVMDEANFIANIGTDSHEKCYDFAVGNVAIPMTGTPANKPGDAYGLIKFTAPGTYRNHRHFENTHVADRDFFGNPSAWANLELLHENLKINSNRILLKDLYPNIEEALFVPVEYSLDRDHAKLYRRLADDELLKLPDGGKIDATTANRLMHALGQIVINYDHFSGDPKARSSAIELVEEKLAELGDGKLVVFAHYRMTVASLVRHFTKQGAVGVNSEVSAGQKQKNIARFIEDPKCRLLVAQVISAGKGLDGLQYVSNHCLFIEPCQQPRDFFQAVGRLQRPGQKARVVVYLGIAEGTLQRRAFNNLIANDSVVNKVIRNAVDLREAIFGA